MIIKKSKAHFLKIIISIFFIFIFASSLSACSFNNLFEDEKKPSDNKQDNLSQYTFETSSSEAKKKASKSNESKKEDNSSSLSNSYKEALKTLSVTSYTGQPYKVVNNNQPFFSSSDYKKKEFEEYAPLDKYGRCTYSFAMIGENMMPTEARTSIGMIKPTGWQTVKYDFIDGKYLYNRCHLIGYQLTGENANKNNLITGTRYMNISGMLPFENEAASFLRTNNKHLLYRATPIFKGNNLLADGILLEVSSVEDKGADLSFCVFIYNIQPGVNIDYSNGNNKTS